MGGAELECGRIEIDAPESTKKLKLFLESFGMTDVQRTSKWLDYPMCGSETRPSVLWDNLLALRPKTLDDAQVALFIRKLPRHISAMIKPSPLTRRRI